MDVDSSNGMDYDKQHEGYMHGRVPHLTPRLYYT